MPSPYRTFREFYPFYLSEHQNPTCRRLHFLGTSLVLALMILALLLKRWWLLLGVPVAGYGLAWTGHFFFEKNRPATFTHPLFSLSGDWVMFKDILLGKIKF